jgi:hypothetical protein
MDVRNQVRRNHGLRKDLFNRTVPPAKNFTIWAFFLVGVVFFGGAGIWAEVWSYFSKAHSPSFDSLRTALVTFFPAIVGGAVFQLVLEKNNTVQMKAFAFALLVPISLAFFYCFTKNYDGEGGVYTDLLSVVFTLLSLWVWWLANSSNPDFVDQIDILAPVGGDVNDELAGDLDGFRE